MSNALANSPVTFHLSMNVSDISRSVEFFSKVFGTPPAKHRKDYAKFELQNPPITFSLEPIAPGERGALNHVGFKLPSVEELVAFQRRLEASGIRSEREEGVECCYAKQTKFWLHDPDGTLWEMYVLEGDLEHRGAGQPSKTVMGDADAESSSVPLSIGCAVIDQPVEKQQWSHRLGSPLAIPDEFGPESLDEVALQGTFNGEGTSSHVGRFLKEVADRLKAGGRLSIHCLTADRHVDAVPPLPGPASVVQSVPCLDSLMDDLEEAGFESVRLTKYGSRACFTAGEAELRETKIEALKPVDSNNDRLSVVYRGPFREMMLDDGTTLPRGRRTEVSRAAIEQLQSTSVGDSLVIIERATAPISCSGSTLSEPSSID